MLTGALLTLVGKEAADVKESTITSPVFACSCSLANHVQRVKGCSSGCVSLVQLCSQLAFEITSTQPRMAPPKSPWNKIASNVPVHQHGFPAPAKASAKENMPNKPFSPAPVNEGNEQAQEDEIEVLKAIYMEDFEEIESKGAWSVSLFTDVFRSNSRVSTRNSCLYLYLACNDSSVKRDSDTSFADNGPENH